MSDRPQSRPWWLAAGILALGVISLWGGMQLPAASRYAGVGPGFVAMAVGVALILLSGLLALSILRGERFEPQSEENADAALPMNPVAFALALAAAALPVFILRPLGLPVTATICFVLVTRAFGSRTPVKDLIAGAVLGSLSWVLFNRLGLQLGDFFPPAGF